MNYLYKFRLKNVDAALRFGFREISRYSRHSSSAEPDVGCVYHHTIQRWTIYISSYSKKLKRRYGLAFEKFRDIRDIYRAPNRMSVCIPSYYTTMNISIRADSKKLKRCNGRTRLFQWGVVQLTFSMIPRPPGGGTSEELVRSIRVGAHLEYRCNLFQNVLRWSVEPPWTCLLQKEEEQGRSKGEVHIFKIYFIDSKRLQVDRLKTLGRVHYTKHSIYLWNAVGGAMF